MFERFSERATQVVVLAQDEARSLEHNHGTKNILLGLVRGNEGVGARILADFGADRQTVAREVTRMMSGKARPRYVEGFSGEAPAKVHEGWLPALLRVPRGVADYEPRFFPRAAPLRWRGSSARSRSDSAS